MRIALQLAGLAGLAIVGVPRSEDGMAYGVIPQMSDCNRDLLAKHVTRARDEAEMSLLVRDDRLT